MRRYVNDKIYGEKVKKSLGRKSANVRRFTLLPSLTRKKSHPQPTPKRYMTLKVYVYSLCVYSPSGDTCVCTVA
jgi:hypothetical protein